MPQVNRVCLALAAVATAPFNLIAMGAQSQVELLVALGCPELTYNAVGQTARMEAEERGHAPVAAWLSAREPARLPHEPSSSDINIRDFATGAAWHAGESSVEESSERPSPRRVRKLAAVLPADTVARAERVSSESG